MTTQKHAKKMYVHLTLNPDEEMRAILQKTWDAHASACNKYSQAVFEDAVKHKRPALCAKHDDPALNRASTVARSCHLHASYGLSVLDTVSNAYANAHMDMEHLEPIRFDKYESGAKKPTIHLRWKNAIVLDFQTKKCQLDLYEKKYLIPFSFPEGIPEPNWSISKGFLKKAYDDWEVVAGIENPMAEIDVQRISNIVGIDLGQRNIATTDSPEKGAKRYACPDYFGGDRTYPTQTARYRALMGKDVLVAWDITHHEPEGTLFILENLHCTTVKGWSYRNFRDWFVYFAAQRHQYVHFCSAYGTSTTCSHCGETKNVTRDKDAHRFMCHHCHYGEEGVIVNDDENAAKNIYKRGKKDIFG